MAQQKVAIVTGANKGIGLAIVKGLCKDFQGLVYLTARDEKRGTSAVNELSQLGFHSKFYQLDIDNDASVNKLRDYLKKEYGGIDLLINNAAIAFKVNATEPMSYQAEHTVNTNYFGTLRVCNALFPLLRTNASVVNVSSSAGRVSRIPSAELKNQFLNNQLTITELNELMKKFVEETKLGTHEKNGWGNSAYVVSKVGVGAMTRIQQRQFDTESPNRNISVNAVHPGYVATDMTSHKGTLTVEEGAQSTLYLALQSPGLKGQFIWHDKRVCSWDADTLN